MITFANSHEMETPKPELHGHAGIHGLGHMNYAKNEVQFLPLFCSTQLLLLSFNSNVNTENASLVGRLVNPKA